MATLVDETPPITEENFSSSFLSYHDFQTFSKIEIVQRAEEALSKKDKELQEALAKIEAYAINQGNSHQ